MTTEPLEQAAARAPGRTGRPATISDVAARAGVSRATVSRVVNGNATVDPDIATRVSAAVAELDYRPSALARNLSLGRTQTIAVVVPDLENPMFQAVLRGVTRAAAADGYRVLVADTEERVGEEEEIAREARRRCDALVLCSPRMPDAQLAALVHSLHPVVLVNRELPGAVVPVVGIDYASAATELVRHLLALGHRSIAYLSGPEGSTSDRQRRRGIAGALADFAGLAEAGPASVVPEITDIPTGARIEDGHRAADAFAASGCTAAVAFNDLVALGALTRLRELGIDVPGEVSVVGIDDIPVAAYAAPPLTTASVPQLEIGTEAWRRLQEAIAGSVDTSALSYRPRLVLRESTGPAAPRSVAPGEDQVVWRTVRRPGESDAQQVTFGGRMLARYDSGASMPTDHAPRPYLHPIETVGGTTVTALAPADHLHHYGLSLAVPDVDGTSYWGGRTFVRGSGSTQLDNHGRQTRRSSTVSVRRGGGPSVDGPSVDGRPNALSVLAEELTWFAHDGEPHLDESRSIAAGRGEEGWTLGWRSELRAVHRGFTIGSPATNGRPGAGYGGIFWRLAVGDDARVLTADGEGEANAHESLSPWLAITQTVGGREVSVVLSQPGVATRAWFVRIAEYVGAGPMLAPAFPVTVRSGDRVATALAGTLLDRPITDRADAARVARATERILAP